MEFLLFTVSLHPTDWCGESKIIFSNWTESRLNWSSLGYRNKEKVSAVTSSLSLKSKNQVGILGVIMDMDLNFHSHIKSITSSAFYHLKNISKVKGILSKPDLEKRIHAFISSRWDYCNGLLTRQLQLIQNAAARGLIKTRKYNHIKPVLRSHWLPVAQRIDFKTTLLVYKSLNGLAPEYISDVLVPNEPSETLRTSGIGLLLVPRVRTKHGETDEIKQASTSRGR